MPDQMQEKKILVTALGRQGWAIVRQLVELLPIESTNILYVYERFAEVEESRLPRSLLFSEHGDTLPAVYRAYRTGRIKKLREAYPILKNASASEDELCRAIIALQPHMIINAATFTGHELYTRLAFEVDADYIDLGQDTWQALGQRTWDHRIRAERRKMRLVPEAGVAPGLVSILGDWLLQEGGDSLYIRVGGLPMDTNKGGNLHYGISWSPEGVVKEYTDVTLMRKNNLLLPISGLYAHEEREVAGSSAVGVAPLQVNDPSIIKRLQTQGMQGEFLTRHNGSWAIQNLEACPTSDGISLMPFDQRYAMLCNLDYKTLRYAGHFDSVERSLRDGTLVEQLTKLPRATPDIALLRVWTEQQGQMLGLVEGIVLGDRELDDSTHEAQPEMGPEPVFSAMQHVTGWPTVLIALALLSFRNPSSDPRPQLFGLDRKLWSGRGLDEALAEGGVIMPYELVDGRRMLSTLLSGGLIPEAEFHVLGVPATQAVVTSRRGAGI